MEYEQLEYTCGATIEIIKHIPRCLRGAGRTRTKKSAAEIEEANAKQAARKLVRKLNANFRPGDVHAILTYDGKKGRPTPDDAKGIIKLFHQAMRKEFRKRKAPYKYILVTEYENKSIHHHIIINQINDGKVTTNDLVRKCWRQAGGTGRPKYVDLDDTGEYEKLAAYLIKETEKTYRKPGGFKQRYSCSRNLIDPKPEKRTMHVKGMWAMEPKARPGYRILQDLTYNGTDKLGYLYQRYYMVKITPSPEDWESPEKTLMRKRRRRKGAKWGKSKCRKVQRKEQGPADSVAR